MIIIREAGENKTQKNEGPWGLGYAGKQTLFFWGLFFFWKEKYLMVSVCVSVRTPTLKWNLKKLKRWMLVIAIILYILRDFK